MSDANEPGQDERPLVGARFRHQGRSRDRSRSDGRGDRFTVVLRGYDRYEVDDRFQELDAEVDRLRSELRAAQDRLDEYRGEVERLQQGAQRAPRGEWGADEPVTNRGPLADKIIRSAQREALLIRANAQKEATRILEAAQAAVTAEMVLPQPRSLGSTS